MRCKKDDRLVRRAWLKRKKDDRLVGRAWLAHKTCGGCARERCDDGRKVEVERIVEEERVVEKRESSERKRGGVVEEWRRRE